MSPRFRKSLSLLAAMYAVCWTAAGASPTESGAPPDFLGRTSPAPALSSGLDDMLRPPPGSARAPSPTRPACDVTEATAFEPALLWERLAAIPPEQRGGTQIDVDAAAVGDWLYIGYVAGNSQAFPRGWFPRSRRDPSQRERHPVFQPAGSGRAASS